MTKKPITTRQEQAIETKQRIYTAAIELMDRKGFENITIAEISKKAHVSVGAFYHYFTSKSDILAEIFRRADDYFATQVAPKLENKNAADRIVEFFVHYARFNVADGVETTQHLYNPTIKFFTKKGRSMHDLLLNIIREGQKKNELRTDDDPEELERFLFVMAWGTVFEWSLLNGRFNLEAVMKKRIKILVATMVK